MRRFAFALLACGVLTMGGCTSLPPLEDLSAKIKQAQDSARAACAFVPTVETVASLFGTGKFQSAFDAAKAICDAVAKVSAQRGSGVPVVAGVPIKGHRVAR